jgi:16S rRNA (uracil1498-N3)-methyltransferase
MRRFYSPPEAFRPGEVLLGSDDTRHLRDVLRLRAGEFVQVFDGGGSEFYCSIREILKKETILTVIREIPPPAPESPLELTLAAAVTKGEKFDLIIQKGVELGLSRLVPLVTARCDVRLKEPVRRLERWQRIIIEASKQCGRAMLMKIGEPVAFSKFTAEERHGSRLLFFSERGGGKLPVSPESEKLTALVGPEGGWEDSELETARAAGASLVTLGGRILRAETAAITVTSILQHRFGDLR